MPGRRNEFLAAMRSEQSNAGGKVLQSLMILMMLFDPEALPEQTRPPWKRF
jgi:hypothetical protein